MPLARDKLTGKDSREGFSASAIEGKILCFRRWAFGATTDLARTKSESTDFGGNAHSAAEEYLRSGKMPDYTTKEGLAIGKGLHLLPRPGSVVVEEPFAFYVEDFLFDGFIDFRAPDWRGVGDHKFISSVKMPVPWLTWRTEPYHDLVPDDHPWYPIDPEDFRGKVQPNLYALACGVRARSASTFCHWIWYPKKSSDRVAINTTVQIQTSDAQEFMFDEILPHAIDMRAARKHLRAIPKHLRVLEINRSIPCNMAACVAYAKLCDYSEHCTR